MLKIFISIFMFLFCIVIVAVFYRSYSANSCDQSLKIENEISASRFAIDHWRSIVKQREIIHKDDIIFKNIILDDSFYREYKIRKLKYNFNFAEVWNVLFSKKLDGVSFYFETEFTACGYLTEETKFWKTEK